MKALNKIMLLAAVTVASMGLDADTLYWQLSNNPNQDTYAAVVVQDNGSKVGYLNLLSGDGGAAVSTITTASDAMANVQYADVTGYTGAGYSFYIEMLSLVDDNWIQGWTSTVMTYDQLSESGYISSGGMSVSTVKTWTATVQIPEPAGGLLLLVGGSLLALRRKRRV